MQPRIAVVKSVRPSIRLSQVFVAWRKSQFLYPINYPILMNPNEHVFLVKIKPLSERDHSHSLISSVKFN